MRWWRSLSVDQPQRRLVVLFVVAGLLVIGVGCVALRQSTREAVVDIVCGVVFLTCAAVIYSRHRSTRP